MDSAILAAKVADLHNRSFTVDAHFDLPYVLANNRERGARQVVEATYLPQFKAGGFDLIVSALFISDYFLPEMGLRRALDQISHVHEEIAESPGLFRLCRSTAEARAAKAAGEVALLLSLEGADPLQGDIRLLRIFYELGVRGLGLVWSRRNAAGDGSFFTPARSGRRGGLTPFGIQLIEQAEKLGMFVDVSHLNDEGFADVMEVATKPVIASHSNCRALAATLRNLSDRQIRAIAAGNGVIGMNSINVFVRDDGPEATLADLADHVDHIVQLCGIRHVGLGLDLCDSFRDFLQLPAAIESRDTLHSHAELGTFTETLLRRGYGDEDILAVLGGNFLRVFQACIG